MPSVRSQYACFRSNFLFTGLTTAVEDAIPSILLQSLAAVTGTCDCAFVAATQFVCRSGTLVARAHLLRQENCRVVSTALAQSRTTGEICGCGRRAFALVC